MAFGNRKVLWGCVETQDRLWPCNCKEEREAFWASSFSANPQFKYRHPVGAHELARFGVHTEYLPLATRILDSVMATYGSEKVQPSPTD